MINDRDQRIREALERFRPGSSVDASYDFGLPTRPIGHAQGLEIATHIAHDFRETWRPHSMKITPQQVIDAIVAGGVKNWVLMGLYGYVGYLSQARATQDVDVMVAREERDAAVAAKHSAIVSPYREWVRKQQYAIDLRRIVLPDPERIDRGEAHRLGELIFPGGGDELLEFIQLAIDQKPFPV